MTICPDIHMADQDNKAFAIIPLHPLVETFHWLKHWGGFAPNSFELIHNNIITDETNNIIK